MEKHESFLEKLNKRFGKNLAFLGNDASVEKCEVIPTNVLPLDVSLGIGGVPRGRITDIYGQPAVGKSSFCFHLMAQAQKQGITCALIDAEYSYRPEYVEHFGVDSSQLIVLHPDCFEEGAEALDELVENDIGLIVVDSLSSMVPRSESESEHGKSPMAIQARLISQMMRKMVSKIAKHNCAVIFVNQMRVNLMAMNPYDRYTVTGGQALKFYASLRLEVKRKSALTRGKEIIGHEIEFRIKKNKLARLADACTIRYSFDHGFEREGDVVEIALNKGVLHRDGNTIFHGETRLAVGKEKAEAFLQANPDLKQQIISELLPQTEQ